MLFIAVVKLDATVQKSCGLHKVQLFHISNCLLSNIGSCQPMILGREGGGGWGWGGSLKKMLIYVLDNSWTLNEKINQFTSH